MISLSLCIMKAFFLFLSSGLIVGWGWKSNPKVTTSCAPRVLQWRKGVCCTPNPLPLSPLEGAASRERFYGTSLSLPSTTWPKEKQRPSAVPLEICTANSDKFPIKEKIMFQGWPKWELTKPLEMREFGLRDSRICIPSPHLLPGLRHFLFFLEDWDKETGYKTAWLWGITINPCFQWIFSSLDVTSGLQVM